MKWKYTYIAAILPIYLDQLVLGNKNNWGVHELLASSKIGAAFPKDLWVAGSKLFQMSGSFLLYHNLSLMSVHILTEMEVDILINKKVINQNGT